MSYMVHRAGLAIAYDSFNFSPQCDRCNSKIGLNNQGYHCRQCPDFDVCEVCAAEGLYCENDTHNWRTYHIENGINERVYTGPVLTTSGGTILQPGSKPYPTMFRPRAENDTPHSVFTTAHRYVNKQNLRQILIYTDGACSRNGQADAQGGSSFVYRKSTYDQNGELEFGGTIHFALEDRGPTGKTYVHTSNRAELRAVIAALQHRDWVRDCTKSWRSIVIATDSEYVAVNATAPDRIERWEANGWRLADGSKVKNLDLWRLLLQIFRILQSSGLNVSFWRIPREWNTRADEFAKLGVKIALKPTFHKVIATGYTTIKYIPYTYDANSDDI